MTTEDWKIEDRKMKAHYLPVQNFPVSFLGFVSSGWWFERHWERNLPCSDAGHIQTIFRTWGYWVPGLQRQVFE